MHKRYIHTYVSGWLRSRGKRIKNIEHVLPGINNIRKRKIRRRWRQPRKSLLRELNGGTRTRRGCRPQRFGDICRTRCGPVFLRVYAS
jgi:hypothetical protein